MKALLLLLACAVLTDPGVARADDATPAPSNPCTLASEEDVARILGYPVQPPDPLSAANGSCYYYSRSATEDGLLAYAVVRDGDMERVRRMFTIARISCNGVDPKAPRYNVCRTYSQLAIAESAKAYCDDRIAQPDAQPLESAVLHATYASGSLFTFARNACVESRVMHGDEPEQDAEAELLALLLKAL